MDESKAAAAFADLARKPAKYGTCRRCAKHTEKGDRVIVRTSATAFPPEKGGANRQLGSHGRTFCGACARSLFDDLSGRIENAVADA